MPVFLDHLPGTTIEVFGAIFILRKRITPVAEAAFSELHDIPFMNKGDTGLLLLKCEIEGGADQSLRTLLRDRLNADTCRFREADLLEKLGERFLHVLQEFL